jgi:hypothetical protein
MDGWYVLYYVEYGITRNWPPSLQGRERNVPDIPDISVFEQYYKFFSGQTVIKKIPPQTKGILRQGRFGPFAQTIRNIGIILAIIGQ